MNIIFFIVCTKESAFFSCDKSLNLFKIRAVIQSALNKLRKEVKKLEPYVYILNHGKFGEELIKSAELITGKVDRIKAFSLLPGMSIEEFYANVQSNIEQDSPKIILCDIYGGTPSNVAMMLSRKFGFDILCGINLAMLIELVLSRANGNDIDEVISKAREAASQSIYQPEKIKEGE